MAIVITMALLLNNENDLIILNDAVNDDITNAAPPPLLQLFHCLICFPIFTISLKLSLKVSSKCRFVIWLLGQAGKQGRGGEKFAPFW